MSFVSSGAYFPNDKGYINKSKCMRASYMIYEAFKPDCKYPQTQGLLW